MNFKKNQTWKLVENFILSDFLAINFWFVRKFSWKARKLRLFSTNISMKIKHQMSPFPYQNSQTTRRLLSTSKSSFPHKKWRHQLEKPRISTFHYTNLNTKIIYSLCTDSEPNNFHFHFRFSPKKYTKISSKSCWYFVNN